MYREAEAVLVIVARCERGECTWIGCEILDFEAARSRDPHTIEGSKTLRGTIRECVSLTMLVRRRATELEGLGFRALDALHLASAEEGPADVFPPVDDQFLRCAARITDALGLRVLNPVTWLQEEEI